MSDLEKSNELIKKGEIVLQLAERMESYQEKTLWEEISWEDNIEPMKENWCKDVLSFIEDEFGSSSKAYHDFESCCRHYGHGINEDVECIRDSLTVLRNL